MSRCPPPKVPRKAAKDPLLLFVFPEAGAIAKGSSVWSAPRAPPSTMATSTAVAAANSNLLAPEHAGQTALDLLGPEANGIYDKAVVLLKDGVEVRRWTVRPPIRPAAPEPEPEPEPEPLVMNCQGGSRLGDLLLAPHVRAVRDAAFKAALAKGHTLEEAEMAAMAAGDAVASGFDFDSAMAAGRAMASALKAGHTYSEAKGAAHAAALATSK
eukprot:2300658-Prymnesium_polylepis.1